MHITTPPRSLPFLESTPSSSSSKKTRKPTWLKSLATKPVGMERPVVHVDPTTEKTDGSHRKKLTTYLGIIARDNVNVTFVNWKEFPTAQKDLIWEDI